LLPALPPSTPTKPEQVASVLNDGSAAPSRPVAVYLALPPRLFAPTVATLGAVGLPPGSRIAVEKPFGENLDSAAGAQRDTEGGTETSPDSAALDRFKGSVVAAAALAGIEPAPVVQRGRTTQARRWRGDYVVVVSGAVLAAPEVIQRCVAAHEVAHIALGQSRPRGMRLIGPFVLVLGLALAAIAVVAWMAVILLSAEPTGEMPPFLLGAVASLGLFFFAVIAGSAWMTRLDERAADRFAAEQLHQPITTEAAAFIAELEPRTPRWLGWTRTHPTPGQRVRTTSAASSLPIENHRPVSDEPQDQKSTGLAG
jgi:hypothetical protein